MRCGRRSKGGMQRRDAAGLGEARRSKAGAAGNGMGRCGMAGLAWQDPARHGAVGPGWAKRGRRGMCRRGLAWRGGARSGWAWHGPVRQARNGEARQGMAGQSVARQARRRRARIGRIGLGLARPGEAKQARRNTGANLSTRQNRKKFQLEELQMAASKLNAKTADANGEPLVSKTISIRPVKFERATFELIGQEDVPIVIHRFSAKLKQQMKDKMETGKAASSKKNRDPKNTDQSFFEARYRSKDGWDGFHAGALRKALISACRLVNFKMVLAKLSIFVEKDGVDADEPQIPLVRIYGDAVKQEDMARVETGQPYVTVRAAYHNWRAKAQIRWDSDQFTLDDVTNLLARVGQQVGIGEGRPDSKNSAGMGWGLFDIERSNEKQNGAN